MFFHRVTKGKARGEDSLEACMYYVLISYSYIVSTCMVTVSSARSCVLRSCLVFGP